MTSLNINGKLWSKSDNLGKQLIQKLGWTEGEGLGKNKQGTVTHVKVSLKNDRDGIGMKSDKFSHNAGLLQTFDYDMLLKSKCAEVQVNKIDEPIQRSMSRPKFGRAVRPDFFNHLDNDDWTKILGKPVENKKEINQNIKAEATIDNPNNINMINNTEGELDSKFVTKKMNVNEYFEMQMKQKLARLKMTQTESLDKVSIKTNKRISSDNEDESDSPKKKRSKLSDCISEESKLEKKKRRKERKSMKIEKRCDEHEMNSEIIIKKEKQNVSINLDHEIAESEIKLTHIADLLANEPVREAKKKSKENVTEVKVESVVELVVIADLLGNEPVREEKKKSKENVTEVKVESVEPLSTVLSSPLHTSNFKDLEGYKFY